MTTTVIATARCMGATINQLLDLSDDSISFVIRQTQETLFHVDSSGYLTNSSGESAGKFCLGDNQWFLEIDGEVFAEGPPNGLFKLPEFELVAIIKLLETNSWINNHEPI